MFYPSLSRLLPFLGLSFLTLLGTGSSQASSQAVTLNVPAQYTTIQAAVNAAQNGDTVIVADGTYSGPGNRDIDFNGKSLTITSQHGAASTVIECGGTATADGSGDHRGFYIHSGETNAVISGLTIQNGYGTYTGAPNSGWGGGIFILNSNASIQNCILTGNTAHVGGGIFNYNNNPNGRTDTITVTNCAITGNTAVIGGGVFNDNYNPSSGANSITLTGCNISGNIAQNPDALDGGGEGGGVYNYSYAGGGTITLTNCVIASNSALAAGGVLNDNFQSTNTIALTNCTLSGNSAQNFTGGILNYNSAGSQILLTNSLCYGDFNGEIGGGITTSHCDIQGGALNANPLFVNAATGDYHLQAGSPCLGAGTASGAPATDKDGALRPNPPSIGAYEIALTVGSPVATTTTLASSSNPSVAGQSVTFTATVAGAGGTPTGTVTFTVDGTAQPPVILNGAGKGAYSTSSLTVGPHSITAAYSGDAADAPSTGATQVTISAAPVVSATFAGTDTTTHGAWKGVYGKDGSSIFGDSQSLPSYATVTATGQNAYTWVPSTTDTRALQKAASTTDRIAACWYSYTSFTLDVNLTDSQAHQVGLYCLDWDNLGRTQRIDVLDAATGNLLDSQNVSAFSGGKYLFWKLQGHVLIKVTTLGPNAVVSGLVFDAPGTVAAPPAASSSTATFAGTDTTTHGTWQGVYGKDGSSIFGDSQSLPSYATVTANGQNAYTWVPSTTDTRALLKAGSTTDRLAACWYSYTSFTLDVNLTDGQAHQVGLYCLDWDNLGRVQQIDILDAATGSVLDSENISAFSGGKYLFWTVKGHVLIKVTTLGPNAVVSGLVFDAPGTVAAPPAASAATATFAGTDTTTHGAWKGVYGKAGSSIAQDSATYPSYAQVSATGQTGYTWAASTTDTRALLKASSTTDRIAACWYSYTSFTLDVNLTDGQAHQVGLYCLDWDSLGRTQRIDVLDAATGNLLDSQNVSAFSGGKYLFWTVKGHVLIKVTTLGPNAVVSGLVFD